MCFNKIEDITEALYTLEKSAKKIKTDKPRRKHRKVSVGIKLICVCMFIVAFIIVFCSVLPIYTKYKAKQKESAELKQQENELILERSRLRRIEQYIGTDEYKELYTRYILGYTKPGDEVVDTGD